MTWYLYESLLPIWFEQNGSIEWLIEFKLFLEI